MITERGREKCLKSRPRAEGGLRGLRHLYVRDTVCTRLKREA